MPTSLGKEERQGILRQYLSRLRFPQLFLLLVALFTVDMIAPDPVFLVDEAILGILAVMFGMWRNRSAREPEIKNVTPKHESD